MREARETVTGRGGDRERWFIKHLEGWRADRPLHFSPLTVREIECMSARAPKYTTESVFVYVHMSVCFLPH